MSAGVLAAAVLGLIALAVIVAPLFRSDAAQEERRSRRVSEEEALQSEREMTVGALRDLEDDRALGKIGDADYAEAQASLTKRAIDLMKRLDDVEARRQHPRPEPVPPPTPPQR